MSTIRQVEVTIAANPPPRLDKALARDVPADAHLSRTRLVRLIAEGCVQDGQGPLTDPKAKVAEGQYIVITVTEAEDSETLAQDIPLDIRFEDEDLLVLSKPAGMVVHPAPGSPEGTLVNALLFHFDGRLSGVGGEKRPGIVHRIDKDTSGLLVVAKSDRAHHGLSAQFADHTVERRYLALCYGVPDLGDPRLRGLRGVSAGPSSTIRVATGLERHRHDRQRQAVTFSGGRHAVTHVRLEQAYQGAAALVACQLETGRTHQIRVHMAYIGHGLVGDPVYGGRHKASRTRLGAAAAALEVFDRQALHAATLGFLHPVSGEMMAFEDPLPTDFARLLGELDSDAS